MRQQTEKTRDAEQQNKRRMAQFQNEMRMKTSQEAVFLNQAEYTSGLQANACASLYLRGGTADLNHWSSFSKASSCESRMAGYADVRLWVGSPPRAMQTSILTIPARRCMIRHRSCVSAGNSEDFGMFRKTSVE